MRTSLSAWVDQLGLFVTLWDDATFRTPLGAVITLDPTAVTFTSDAAVGRAARRHGIAILGGSIPAFGRLLGFIRADGANGRAVSMDIAEAMAHPVFGKHLHGVTIEAVLDAFIELEQAA